MPSYEYKAIDKAGRAARGSVDAVNEVDLELRLRRMGLDLITYKQVDRHAATFSSGGKVSRQDLINFCFDLEQMIRSGIPIIDGLRDMRDSIDSPGFRDVLTAMTEDLEGGKILSQCMMGHPVIFDNVFVSLVRAGEQSGQLPEIFKNLADNLKWMDELISQTRRLMILPLMTLVVVLAVLVALLIVLVPQIAGLFKTMGLALPVQTRVLIAISDFMTHYWYVVFGVPIVAVLVLMIVIRGSHRAGYMWDHVKLRLPIVGPTIQKIILSRFANIFALMYRSGITVLDAIKTCENVVDNRVISDSLVRAGQQIAAGESLTETFQNLGVFPPLIIRMLRVGESTGALDTALMNITYFYNRDVKESVDNAQKMIGPAMTVILGGMLGIVVWAVLGPVYDIFGKLKL